MARVIDTYRRQWPRLGAVIGMAVAGATALSTGKRARPRALSALNLGALLVHQYEEYVDPGWFPGQFNKGLFKSQTPRNYPLNTNTALCVSGRGVVGQIATAHALGSLPGGARTLDRNAMLAPWLAHQV